MRTGIICAALVIGCGAPTGTPEVQPQPPPPAPSRVGPELAPREIPAPSTNPAQNAFTPAPEVIVEVAPPMDPVLMWPTQPVWNEFWFSIDGAMREAKEDVRAVDALVELSAGMRVADIGAGGGYFTFRYAPRVGSAGEIVAADIDRRMSLRIAWEAQRRGVENVRSVWVPRGQLALDRASFDRVMFIDIGAFRECALPEAQGYFTQVADALRPGGRLIIAQGMHVAPDQAHCHPLSAEELIALAAPRFELIARRTILEADQTTVGSEVLSLGLRAP